MVAVWVADDFGISADGRSVQHGTARFCHLLACRAHVFLNLLNRRLDEQGVMDWGAHANVPLDRSDNRKP